MLGFVVKPSTLGVIWPAKELLITTATVTASQSVLTTAAKMRNAGWDFRNEGKTRKILDHAIWH